MRTATPHRLATALGVTALLALGACGDDDEPAVADPSTSAEATGDASAEVTVDIVEFAFAPREVEVAVGGAVVFTNSDEFAHTAEADDGSFDTGDLAGGEASVPVTFDEPGTYPYFCGIHNYMTGTVTVTG